MPSRSEVWNQLFQDMIRHRSGLSAYLFFAYADAWESLPDLSRRYLRDERRGWTSLTFESLSDDGTGILEFSSSRRNPVRFYIERVGRFGKVRAFRAFSTNRGSVRGSTLESFVNWARGLWFPRLSYRFMDDLSGLLHESFPNAAVEMTEYVANVFERLEEGGLSKQQTIRTWVQREGDREYDIYRSLNLEINRVVTLSGARFNILFKDSRGKLDFRLDHTCRALLNSPHLDEFRTILELVSGEARKELQRYQLRKRIRAREGKSDLGEKVLFIDYAGTEFLPLTIQSRNQQWFESLSTMLSNAEYLTDSEALVPFVLDRGEPPSLQARLVDLEAQTSYTLTASKEQNRIDIAPEGIESHASSIGKIINVLEKIAGASSVQV